MIGSWLLRVVNEASLLPTADMRRDRDSKAKASAARLGCATSFVLNGFVSSGLPGMVDHIGPWVVREFPRRSSDPHLRGFSRRRETEVELDMAYSFAGREPRE